MNWILNNIVFLNIKRFTVQDLQNSICLQPKFLNKNPGFNFWFNVFGSNFWYPSAKFVCFAPWPQQITVISQTIVSLLKSIYSEYKLLQTQFKKQYSIFPYLNVSFCLHILRQRKYFIFQRNFTERKSWHLFWFGTC